MQLTMNSCVSLFPCLVATPVLTLSFPKCGSNALVSAITLTAATDVLGFANFATTRGQRLFNFSATSATDSRTFATDSRTFAGLKTDFVFGPVIGTIIGGLAIEAALVRSALSLSWVDATALYPFTGVGLNIAIAEKANVSVTTPTLGPRMDTKQQPFKAMMWFVRTKTKFPLIHDAINITGGAVPITGYTNMALPRYFNITAVLTPHTAATDSSSAYYAAAEDQAAPLTQNYSVTSAA